MPSISEKWNLYKQTHPLFTYDLTCCSFVCLYGTLAMIGSLITFGLWIPFSIFIGSLTKYNEIVTISMIVCPATSFATFLCWCAFKSYFVKDCVLFYNSGSDFLLFMNSTNPDEHIADQK